jgi:hypothetical protein
MTLSEMLSQERQDYLSVWMGSLLEHREKFPPAVAEVLILPNSTIEPLPYRYVRPDILCGGAEKPQIIEINKDKYYSFKPFDFTVSGKIPGRLFPLHWNAMEFRLFGKIESWSDFEKWIHHWLDIEDARYEKDKEIANVIHNVTAPEYIDGCFSFSVDMGSAEVGAFFELISLFPGMGVSRFEVGSFSMIDNEQKQE